MVVDNKLVQVVRRAQNALELLAHPAEKATVKIVPKNPEAVISIEGVANPDGKGEYITEVALTSSLVTEMNITTPGRPAGSSSKIGRASCRERV